MRTLPVASSLAAGEEGAAVSPLPKFAMAAALLCVLFCSLWVFMKVIRYGVNVPFWDQWDYVAQLRDQDRGELSWIDIITGAAGEHLVGGQVLLSAVGWQLTDMHHRGLMVTNWLLALGFCLLAMWMTARETGYRSPVPWAVLGASSFFIFNPAAYQLWLWGLPQVYLLIYVFLVAGTLVIQSRLGVNPKLVCIAALSFVATFVLGNGAALWVLLPAVLATYHSGRELLSRRFGAIVYLGLLAVTALSYLLLVASYRSPAPQSADSTLTPILTFFLTYTGNLISLAVPSTAVAVAQLVGLLLIGLYFLTGYFALRSASNIERRRVVMLWVMIGGLSLLSGLPVALARHSFGPTYPLEASRYVLASAPLPIAVLVLSAIALENLAARGRQGLGAYSVLLFFTAGLMFVGVGARVQQTRSATAVMAHSRVSNLTGKVAALASPYMELPTYRQIYPHDNFSEFRSSAKYLSEVGWLRPRVWDRDLVAELQTAKADASTGNLDKISINGQTLDLSGWAYLPRRAERAHAVIITASQNGTLTLIGATSTSQPRPDVHKIVGTDESFATGWSASIPVGRLPPPGAPALIRCYAYDAESGDAHLLANEKEITLAAPAQPPMTRAQAATASR